MEFELGDLDAALRSLEHVLRLEPNNATAWVDYAEINLEAGRHDEGLLAARRAVELGDRLPEAWFFIAEAHLLRRDRAAALDALETLARIAPDGRDSDGQPLPDLTAYREYRWVLKGGKA